MWVKKELGGVTISRGELTSLGPLQMGVYSLMAAAPDERVDLIQIKETGHVTGLLFVAINRETIMKKLSLFACVSAALVCAAVPSSFNWSPANVTLFSLHAAEARVGRPLTAMSVAGVSRRVHRREYRRGAAGAAVGAAAVGGAAAQTAYVDEEDEDRTAISRPGPAAPAYGPGP